MFTLQNYNKFVISPNFFATFFQKNQFSCIFNISAANFGKKTQKKPPFRKDGFRNYGGERAPFN